MASPRLNVLEEFLAVSRPTSLPKLKSPKDNSLKSLGLFNCIRLLPLSYHVRWHQLALQGRCQGKFFSSYPVRRRVVPLSYRTRCNDQYFQEGCRDPVYHRALFPEITHLVDTGFGRTAASSLYHCSYRSIARASASFGRAEASYARIVVK